MRIISNTPKLDPTQNYLVARALDCSIKEFYAIPENQGSFEKWKRKRRKEAKRGQNNGTDSSAD